MTLPPIYIVAARRTALGRVGGLHRQRRLEQLTSPLVAAVLADAGIEPGDIDEFILGSTSETGNPARLTALAAGLAETCPAWTIDRGAASGLDAVIAAARSIATGAAQIVIAGGAEALSTAPWRVARPRLLHQTPRFLADPREVADDGEAATEVRAAEAIAARLGLTRADQDAFAAASHRAAGAALAARRFLREIVALKVAPCETRDEIAHTAEPEQFGTLAPILGDDGMVTEATASPPADGAALLIVASEAAYRRLGSPSALRLLAAHAAGVPAQAPRPAPLVALERAFATAKAGPMSALTALETGEASAAEAIELERTLGLVPGVLNGAGGALARGRPGAAAGAVALARLFTDMVRLPRAGQQLGAVVQGAGAGLGVAALFEAAGP